MNRNDQQFMAQKIRTQYMEKESTELDELRALDKKIKRPVNIFSYTIGSLGAIIMGSGMSLAMTDLGVYMSLTYVVSMTIGVVTGIFGCALVALSYPAYNMIVKKRREQLAPEILRLADELTK